MLVVGLCGPFGSGCSYVSKLIVQEYHFEPISLSKILRSEYEKDNPGKSPLRQELQEYGDKIRQERGCEFLAKEAWKIIQKDLSKSYIVDSIRNPIEANYLRESCSSFYLLGIFADADVRWKRVSEKYDQDRRAFDEDDKRDSNENLKHGQRVTDTFRQSDIVIINNDDFFEGSEGRSNFIFLIREKIDLLEKRIPFRPNVIESCMAMAYAASMKSSCSKRKVGAVIVDELGNVFSSGYNEVPNTQPSCLQKYGRCYRDLLKARFLEDMTNAGVEKENRDTVYGIFKRRFKILDYCRALHAEENAILNVARVGASSALANAMLFTTTYPCNLCANKIAQVGIKTVVYFEPYPMEEAKKILVQKQVRQIPFQGVTYNGYFRLMEEIY